MSQKGHYLFAVLCENIIKEASTTIDAIKKVPGGFNLGRYLHTALNIPHDAPFRPTTDISLGRKGEYSGGRWYVIAGEKGAGALQYNNSDRTYRVIVPRPSDMPYPYNFGSGWGSDQDNQQFIDVDTSSGNGAKALLKKAIGKTQELYTSGASVSKDVMAKQQKRKELKQRPADVLSSDNAASYLLRKFKPTFLRTLKSAEAEYKGMINLMLKSGSYSKIDDKIRYLKKMDSLINHLEVGTSIEKGDIEKALAKPMDRALMIAAQHFYPELTGGIRREYGSYRTESNEGLIKMIDDIKNGDTKKLSTVLTYFKNAILATKP